MEPSNNTQIDVEQYYRMMAEVTAYFGRCLHTSSTAVTYLKDRGVQGRIAAQFGIGFAPSGLSELESILSRYDQKVADAASLVVTDSNSGRKYARFRNRIMFPIKDCHGRIVGFGGRCLQPSDSVPKYLNSQESSFFHKGKLLYGLPASTSYQVTGDRLVVVEGYMDVISLVQAGYRSAVAVLGTACSANHVAKILSMDHRITFCFDGDAAGRRAAARTLEVILPFLTDKTDVNFLFLPESHDPDSFVRSFGVDEFRRLTCDAVQAGTYLKDAIVGDYTLQTIEDISQCLHRARPYWSKMTACSAKQNLLNFCCSISGLDSHRLVSTWSSVVS